MQTFQAIIEQDQDGLLIGSVPALHGCHTQAKTYDELIVRLKEAIELCLEEQDVSNHPKFLALQQVTI